MGMKVLVEMELTYDGRMSEDMETVTYILEQSAEDNNVHLKVISIKEVKDESMGTNEAP